MINVTYLLDPDHCEAEPFKTLHPKTLVSAEAVEAESQHSGLALWIVPSADTSVWLRKALAARPRPRRDWLLLLDEVSPPSLAVFQGQFERVVTRPVSFLPAEELAEVLATEERSDLCIGGIVDPEAQVITLYRGDLNPITIQLSFFAETPLGISPNSADFEVTDFGRTLRFGEYEAAFDIVLYEFDPDYRRRIKDQRLGADRSFGASLRRLRKQRGLTQSDFLPELSEKTIGRIERGEVKQPHGHTLEVLAKVLRVESEEIQSY